RPRAARVLVARLDVAETPRDLGGGAGAPVRPGAGHLAAGQRLRDAVGAAGGVLGPLVPVALALPEDEQGRPAAAPPLQGVRLLAVGLVLRGARVRPGEPLALLAGLQLGARLRLALGLLLQPLQLALVLLVGALLGGGDRV